MAVADDLARSRAALQMINPAPYNAEAPPEALAEAITPTELHYVRSNFAVPAHDGTLAIGGAGANPRAATPASPTPPAAPPRARPPAGGGEPRPGDGAAT